MNKILNQIMMSSLAAFGLLHGIAAQATTLAELPLKASVLAKPNVIFGMDDSGSMDWEILLDTSSGVAYWDTQIATAWQGQVRPIQGNNSPPMTYLFPQGTAAGGQLYGWSAWYGQIAPPTAQFAWLRSAKFNPIYYDPTVTYRPWADAYLSGADKTTFASATPASARPHPLFDSAPRVNLSAQWDAGNVNYLNQNGAFRFYMQAGMVIPAGSTVRFDASGACSGAEQVLAANAVVPAGRACWASIPFFPATYWKPVANCVVGNDCVASPDGNGFLQRHEIKAGNYANATDYATELQNFANWFSYYRKRKLMLGASMGRALEGLTGMRLNVVPFNNRQNLAEMFDADSAVLAKSRLAVAGRFYNNAMSANGTPTHMTMLHIGGQFEDNTNVIQYACQRNAMFIVTDGFANTPGDFATPGYDRNKWAPDQPYKDVTEESLTDIALAYFTRRMRSAGASPLVAGQVPLQPLTPENPNADQNPDLHVNTYGISLGVKGSIWPAQVPASPDWPGSQSPFTLKPNWPLPVGDTPSMLDDLYHATLVGRGEMYLADDPTKLSAAIQSAFDAILKQNSTQGGSSISSVNLDSTEGSAAFSGGYDPAGWKGDVTKASVNRATGATSQVIDWSAAAKLDARATPRVVVAGDGQGGGLLFDADSVGALVNPGDKHGATAAVIAYLRGDRSLEGSTFRRRLSLMGPVVNSVPTYDKDSRMVYVASGEGMLHALNADTGEEEWAYVPYDGLSKIGDTVDKGYIYQTKLDATVAVAKVGANGRLLVGGMGAAGRSYYAIDVSGTPKGLSDADAKARVRWTFPRADDAANRALMGYTVSQPVIVTTVDNQAVVLVTSGYDNGQAIGDGLGRLWMLDANTGVVLKTFVTTDGSASPANEAGLANISAFREPDGLVRYAYGGDLMGNLWRFDLKSGATIKVTQFKREGVNQPVTAPPALVRYSDKRIIMVGTGKLLDIGDLGTSSVQSFYAIADSADNSTLADPRDTTFMVKQTYTRGAVPEFSGTPVNWATKRGWYFDLPAGEKANTRPSVGLTTVAFATNANGGSDCTASSYLYVLDMLNGLKSTAVEYASTVISSTANSTGVTQVKTEDGSVRIKGDVFEPPKPCVGPSCPPPPPDPPCETTGLNVVCKGEGAGAVPAARSAWREVVR